MALRKVHILNPALRACRLYSTHKVLDFHGKENLTVKIRDGRTLGYAEYGSPTGYPLFYLHGYPSSRVEASPLDRMALHRGIRVIAPDRPGFGLSSPQPSRRLGDYPAELLELADALHISRFAVLGCSGGGPYALACARYLDRSTLSAVGVFAGGPHWAACKHLMSRPRRVVAWSSRNAPNVLAVVSNVAFGFIKWLSNLRMVTSRLDKWLESEEKSDETADTGAAIGIRPDVQLSLQDRRQRLIWLLFEGFRQGAAPSVVEARLLSDTRWDFQLEEIPFEPVRIWHGAKDANAPIEGIRYIAKCTPGSVLTEFDKDTHYTMAKYYAQALDELISEEDLKGYVHKEQ